ncbi:type II toxin-antitoxin system VapC family toxin [Thioalkalivibrio paradoxus]|uniref:Ribonuclease VapC n=1 Tax=Thioalkalivibrio paradoxus ARh 1 TaxID=713585 RepID=W0DGC3_9GAMM|nr:type II toxin-antitoxin system VapC family toxin [Thioalkalivibrio paradoxus]AHE97674.1 twitching motility protein PilT [Thioalkalivibrio paradoxus ARh 1]
MAARLLLDTDVLIDYLRGVPEAVTYLESRKEVFLISAVTVGELYAGVREGRERKALDAFMGAFEIVVLDASLAERGGLLRRDYGKSHGTGLADALIAASAERQEAVLVTLNRKHFPMLREVLVPYEKRRVPS